GDLACGGRWHSTADARTDARGGAAPGLAHARAAARAATHPRRSRSTRRAPKRAPRGGALRRPDRRDTRSRRGKETELRMTTRANLVAGLDIGSTKTCAVIAEVASVVKGQASIKVLGVGQTKT